MDKNIDYATPFAAWETRLYLNTHPCDKCALAYYIELCKKCGCQMNYACVPEDEYSADRWKWVDDPWPWEYEFNCRRHNQSEMPNQYQRRGQ